MEGDEARQEVAVIYGFPELARNDAVVQSLEAILAATSSLTAAVLDRFAPYKRGNRGIIKFRSSVAKECFLDVYRELAESDKPKFNNNVLVAVREKPLAARRRSAKLFETGELLRQVLGPDPQLEVIPGRGLICVDGGDSDGTILAHCAWGSEKTQLNLEKIGKVYGREAAARLSTEAI